MQFFIFFPNREKLKKNEGSAAKGKKAQAVADAGATVRGEIAITRNGLEAENGIHFRA